MTKLPADCVTFQDTQRLGWWPYFKKSDTITDSCLCWVLYCVWQAWYRKIVWWRM